MAVTSCDLCALPSCEIVGSMVHTLCPPANVKVGPHATGEWVDSTLGLSITDNRLQTWGVSRIYWSYFVEPPTGRRLEILTDLSRILKKAMTFQSWRHGKVRTNWHIETESHCQKVTVHKFSTGCTTPFFPCRENARLSVLIIFCKLCFCCFYKKVFLIIFGRCVGSMLSCKCPLALEKWVTTTWNI